MKKCKNICSLDTASETALSMSSYQLRACRARLAGGATAALVAAAPVAPCKKTETGPWLDRSLFNILLQNCDTGCLLACVNLSEGSIQGNSTDGSIRINAIGDALVVVGPLGSNTSKWHFTALLGGGVVRA